MEEYLPQMNFSPRTAGGGGGGKYYSPRFPENVVQIELKTFEKMAF